MSVKNHTAQIIEGLLLPFKIEFGNEEHIKLRNRIAKRKKIREDGIICPCGETRISNPIIIDNDTLHWHCGCGWDGKASRDDDGDFGN